MERKPIYGHRSLLAVFQFVIVWKKDVQVIFQNSERMAKWRDVDSVFRNLIILSPRRVDHKSVLALFIQPTKPTSA